MLRTSWLSRRLFVQIPLFLARSLPSPPLPPSLTFFLQSHLLAGVINDLTDTPDERSPESVKQVVIKVDAVSLHKDEEKKIWKGGKREGRKGKKEESPSFSRTDSSRVSEKTGKRGKVHYISRDINPPQGIPRTYIYIYVRSTYGIKTCAAEISIIRYEVRRMHPGEVEYATETRKLAKRAKQDCTWNQRHADIHKAVY